MRTYTKHLFFLLIALFVSTVGYAYEQVTIDGVVYSINESNSAYLEHVPKDYKGKFTIPESITYNGKEYEVTFILVYAFQDCSAITSIVIPSTVTGMSEEGMSFNGCTSLESFVVDEGNQNYTAVNGALFDKEVTRLIRVPATYTSYTVPNTVIYFDSYAFKDCTRMETINVENGSEKFVSMSGVLYGKEMVTSPNGSTYSEELTRLVKVPGAAMSYTFPEGIKTIDSSAFLDCVNLTSISIPPSVTRIGYAAFDGCASLESIIFWGEIDDPYGYVSCFDGVQTSTTIYAKTSEHSNIIKFWHGTLEPVEASVIKDLEVSLRSVSFRIEAPDFPGYGFELFTVRAFYPNGEKDLTPDGNGFYTTSITPGQELGFWIFFKFDNAEYTYNFRVTAPELAVIPERSSYKQTSLSWFVKATSDETLSPGECGIIFNGKKYPVNQNGVARITGLIPATEYEYQAYAVYDAYNKLEIKTDVYKAKTMGTDPWIDDWEIDATTIICKGRKTIDDATFKEEWFTVNNKTYPGNELKLTGLEPDMNYTIEYTVTTEEGSTETARYKKETDKIELETERPKCVSSTCAIVSALTNISEDEPNVGFQWRKYDAPESLPSNEGYAAIYEGRLEGYIKNLQPTSYYNVRAFYKSAADKYYYSEWMTFDPSDFSYFEPTVHTYPIEDVTDTSAKVKGYALAGTDEITEQGFEYWPLGEENKVAVKQISHVQKDGEHDVSVVISSGQVMTAVLDNLLSGTTYCCRAYVKTISGTTFGEEQTFTTTGTTGINMAVTGQAKPTVTGCYDINGRKLNAPARGINIIKYSDGTARKVVIK